MSKTALHSFLWQVRTTFLKLLFLFDRSTLALPSTKIEKKSQISLIDIYFKERKGKWKREQSMKEKLSVSSVKLWKSLFSLYKYKRYSKLKVILLKLNKKPGIFKNGKPLIAIVHRNGHIPWFFFFLSTLQQNKMSFGRCHSASYSHIYFTRLERQEKVKNNCFFP